MVSRWAVDFGGIHRNPDGAIVYYFLKGTRRGGFKRRPCRPKIGAFLKKRGLLISAKRRGLFREPGGKETSVTLREFKERKTGQKIDWD